MLVMSHSLTHKTAKFVASSFNCGGSGGQNIQSPLERNHQKSGAERGIFIIPNN